MVHNSGGHTVPHEVVKGAIMKSPSRLGALTLALVCGTLSGFGAEHFYQVDPWFVGAPLRSLEWVFGVWILLLFPYLYVFSGLYRSTAIPFCPMRHLWRNTLSPTYGVH